MEKWKSARIVHPPTTSYAKIAVPVYTGIAYRYIDRPHTGTPVPLGTGTGAGTGGDRYLCRCRYRNSTLCNQLPLAKRCISDWLKTLRTSSMGGWARSWAVC